MGQGDREQDNLTQAEAEERAGVVSDCRYDVELQLSDDPAVATFRSSVSLRFRAARSSTFLDLDADEVESLRVNGGDVDVAAWHDNRVALQNLVEGENTVDVVAQCRYGSNGVGMHRLVDGDGSVYLYTNCEPFDAHRWFACFDQPDLKGEFALTVAAPSAWKVYSNQPVEATLDGNAEGLRRVRHERTPRLSTYLIALVAGPYHEWTDEHAGIPLTLSCRESLAEYLDAEEIFAVTKAGFDLYTTVFKRPYPFKQYVQAWCPDFNVGAMENAGCVTFNDEAYTPRSRKTDAWYRNRANTILHEMAHMWFGDLVTMKWWDDLWLNESFATFMAYYALTNATKWNDAWVDFANTEKTWAARQDQLPSTHPVAISGPEAADIARVFLNFDGITYAKGASVLRALVAYVTEERFFVGLQTYFRRYEWSNATFGDFLRVLEEASGKPLTEWADAWLRTTGMSTLRIDLDQSAGVYSSGTLTQQPAPGSDILRPHRVGVALYDRRDGRLVRRTRFEVDLLTARCDVAELRGQKAADVVLINDGDLTFAKVRLDERSLQALVADLGTIEEPLARTLCWSAVWDLTRDAEFPASTFVDMVARHAATETQVGVLQRLLMQARSAIELYVHAEIRDGARQQLCSAAADALAACDPGSDAQLAWAGAYIATARRDVDVDRLRRLYDGAEVVPGLEVDLDLRWSIIDRLAASGRADEDLIRAQQRSGGDSMDALRAETDLAARPDSAVKADVWRRLTTPGEKLQTLNSMIAGFHQPDQASMLSEYVEHYESAVSSFWSRPKEEAAALTTGLYPPYVVDEAVIEMADRLLSNTDLPDPARRIIAEQRDATERARRAQQADRQATESAVAAGS